MEVTLRRIRELGCLSVFRSFRPSTLGISSRKSPVEGHPPLHTFYLDSPFTSEGSYTEPVPSGTLTSREFTGHNYQYETGPGEVLTDDGTLRKDDPVHTHHTHTCTRKHTHVRTFGHHDSSVTGLSSNAPQDEEGGRWVSRGRDDPILDDFGSLAQNQLRRGG